MYGDFLLLAGDDETQRAERLAFGDTGGRNEAWLRDTLFEHPELLPIGEVDPSFGPLIPLCTELGTAAGPIDAAFISPFGRLTLVECKLWRNPEARRKVVAQILDYARVVSTWSYADLQRQVAARTQKLGNVPYDIARASNVTLNEQRFVDQVTRSLRDGRFALLIAGDGIREDVSGITDLISRNSAMGFSFGLIEVALYGLPSGGMLVQPRLVARTKTIERTVVMVRDGSQMVVDEAEEEALGQVDVTQAEGQKQAAYRRWWQPVLDTHLDDPEQDPPKLFWPNNVRAQLPLKGTWVLCFATADGRVGVCTAGRTPYYDEFIRFAKASREAVLSELPAGAECRPFSSGTGLTFSLEKPMRSFASEEAAKTWLGETLNTFINVLRPRLKEFLRMASDS